MSGLMRDADTGLAWRRVQPAPAAPRSMLVLLHGVGGNETQLAGLAATAGPDVLVVLPQGRLAFGPGQFGWFRVAFTTNGPQIEPEEAEASRIALIRWVANLQREYAIPPSRTVIAGFSQGGIMSASVGLTAPDRVAGFGVLSGRILPELEASLAPSASLRSVRGFIGHGLHDSKLPVAWAERADAWLTQLGVEHTTRLYPIEHTISPAMQSDFEAWYRPLLNADLE